VLPPGERYARLGPNGAGETATVRMIVGLLTPAEGSIGVFGVGALADPSGARRRGRREHGPPALGRRLAVIPPRLIATFARLIGPHCAEARKRRDEQLN